MRRQHQNQRVLELLEIHLKQTKKAFVFQMFKSEVNLIKFLRLDVIPQLLGGGWVSLDVWVEEGLSAAEVTLQESTAANLEYAEWYCASERAGGCRFL